MVGSRGRIAYAWGAFLVAFALVAAFAGVASPAFAAEVGQRGGMLAAASTQVIPEADDAAGQNAQRVADMARIEDGLYAMESVAFRTYALGVQDASYKAAALVEAQKDDVAEWSRKWLVVQDKKSGYYTIRNLRSRMFLSVGGLVKSQGTKIAQVKGASTKKQLWRPIVANGVVRFASVAAPRYSLCVVRAANGTLRAMLKPTKRALNMRFVLRETEAIGDGESYFLRSAATPTMQIASDDALGMLTLAKRSSSKTQKFRLHKTGDVYRMQCVRSCKFAMTSGDGFAQATSMAGGAKKWVVELDLASGTFTIENALAKKYLDTAQGKLTLRKGAKARTRRFILLPTYGFTVFLDAGHGKNASGWGVYDPGAQGSGKNEADLTKDLVKRIESNLVGTDIRVFNGSQNSVPYWQRNGKARSLGCDVVVSVHFDAGGGSTTSTMVGTRAAAGSRTLNSIIHKKLVSSIGLRDGGTMHRSDITVVNGKVPSVLMEVCFIDNYGCLHKYLNRRGAVAESIAEGIVQASRNPAVQN